MDSDPFYLKDLDSSASNHLSESYANLGFLPIVNLEAITLRSKEGLSVFVFAFLCKYFVFLLLLLCIM